MEPSSCAGKICCVARVAVSSIPISWCSLCCIHSQLVTIERYNINAAFTFINLSFLLAILPKQCTSGWSCWTTNLQGGQQHEENCLFVVEYLFTPEQTYHKNGERVESNTRGDRTKDETRQRLLKPYDTCRTCQLWREDQRRDTTTLVEALRHDTIHAVPGTRYIPSGVSVEVKAREQFCCSYKVPYLFCLCVAR